MALDRCSSDSVTDELRRGNCRKQTLGNGMYRTRNCEWLPANIIPTAASPRFFANTSFGIVWGCKEEEEESWSSVVGAYQDGKAREVTCLKTLLVMVRTNEVTVKTLFSSWISVVAWETGLFRGTTCAVSPESSRADLLVRGQFVDPDRIHISHFISGGYSLPRLVTSPSVNG